MGIFNVIFVFQNNNFILYDELFLLRQEQYEAVLEMIELYTLSLNAFYS